MTHSPVAGVAAALVAALVVGVPLGAAPAFWQVATQADFLRGEVDQLSIDEHGRLMLGPSLEQVFDAEVPSVWSVAPAPDGGVYLGTGNDGRVFLVGRDGTSRLFYDAPEMAVHAMAPAPDGGLLVATSPDGRIYRVNADGSAATFFDPEARYIWAMVVDARGQVFAATGEEGRIYRIAPDGTGEVFHTSTAAHVVSLAIGPDGRLLAGTDSPGRVFRLDDGGRPFLLLDTPFQEVRSLRVDASGHLYAVALSGRAPAAGDAPAEPSPAEAPRQPVPSVSTEITAVAIVDAPVGQAGAAPATPDRRSPMGALYRITPEGLWDQIWESRDDAPYDVVIEGNGDLLMATGHSGKVYRLSGNPLRATLLGRVPAQQTTRLLAHDARTVLVTANPGLLAALSPGRATRGTYVSEVKDAQMVASWGTISWRASVPAGAAIQVFTRSGNTRTPDEAWSEWSAAYANPDGSAIASPSARYLQWRAVLTGTRETPVLTSLTAAYLQRNVRPQVTSITVHPPGLVFQKPFSTGETEIAGFDGPTVDQQMVAQTSSTPALGRRVYQKGLQTFVWRAEDANGDTLAFDVQYRREADTEWKALATGLTESIYVWDTSSVPNGTYTIRIVASDLPSNPPAVALTGELESQSFEVDNTPPVVTFGASRREGSRIIVGFEVRDTDTPLQRVEYSIDAQPWQAVFPRDGILDARVEQFELPLDLALVGRTLVIRATDAMNNVGTGQVVVK
jgi:WD40 repeat protein